MVLCLGSGGSERVIGGWLVGQWIVGVISFQKIFRLYGLKCHIGEKRWGVTLVDGRKCEDRARILNQNSQYNYVNIFNFCQWIIWFDNISPLGSSHWVGTPLQLDSLCIVAQVPPNG